MWIDLDFVDVMTKIEQSRRWETKMSDAKAPRSLTDANQAAYRHRIQSRVDLYLTSILNGIFSDGDLSLSRIDNKMLLDKVEELMKDAMARADKVTEEILKSDSGKI